MKQDSQCLRLTSFDESSNNDVELSIEETASHSYTYSLSYGILGIITINFDMGFGASAGFGCQPDP